MGGAEGQEAVDRNEEHILKGQGEQENWHLWRISPRAQSWVFIHGKGVMAFPIGPLSSKHTDSPCFYCCYSMERDHYKNAPAVSFLQTLCSKADALMISFSYVEGLSLREVEGLAQVTNSTASNWALDYSTQVSVSLGLSFAGEE